MSVPHARLPLVVGFVMFVPFLDGIAQTSATPKYLDPSQSMKVRVDDLVSRMTELACFTEDLPTTSSSCCWRLFAPSPG